MAEKIRNFRHLDIWKKGIEIVKDVHKAVREFPKHGLYGLSAQVQHSSVSIPSDISEGFNRFHNREYKQFLYVALGSCAEPGAPIEIDAVLECLNEGKKAFLLEKLDHESRMLA